MVVWADPFNDPPPLIATVRVGGACPVTIERHPDSSLNSRFSPRVPPPTRGVFSVDDDLLVACDQMDAAFEAWRAAPNALVGFSPRSHSVDTATGRHSYLFHKVWERGSAPRTRTPCKAPRRVLVISCCLPPLPVCGFSILPFVVRPFPVADL